MWNPFGPAGKATSWAGYADNDIDSPSGYINAGTGGGKGPSLGSLWGGAKQADKLGLLSGGEKFLSGLFGGGGGGLSTPNKGDFNYGGHGEDYFTSYGQQLYNRAPVQAQLDQFNQSRGLGMQSRDAINNQVATLRNLANDPNSSQAALQMKAGGAQNMMQALALARSGGGSGAAQGANLRAAQMGNMQANQTLNQQTGIMRAQEIAQANQQIGQLQMQQRAMDLQGAGLDAQTAMQQAQLELGSQQLGQQGLLGMLGLGQNAAALQQKGMTDYWKTLLGAEAAQMQAKQQGMSALIGGGAALGAGLLSDEQTKMNVMPIYGSPIGTNPMMTAGMQVGSGAEMKQNIMPFGSPVGAAGGMGAGAAAAQPQGVSWGQALGDMRAAQAQEDAQSAADKQGFRDRFSKAASIYAAFQPHGQITGLQDPANYLPTLSDARAKKLESENSFLKAHIGDLQRAVKGTSGPLYGSALDYADTAYAPKPTMGHLPVPQRVQPQPRNELEAAQYGTQWLEKNRADAMRDAAAQDAYRKQVEQAQATLAVAQAAQPQTDAMQMYRQDTGAAPVTSDESAKRLRGMLDAAEGRLLKYEDTFGALPKATGNDAYWTQQTHERSGIAPMSMDIERGPRPLAAQAQAIPAYSWQYDPQHAVQANLKNGQPPNAPFGRMQKVGPMAQDLVRIPALRGAVAPGPDGMLQVDGGQAAMTGLSMIGDLSRSQAEIEARLRAIEEGKPPEKRAYEQGRAEQSTALSRARYGSNPNVALDIDDPAMWWGSGI